MVSLSKIVKEDAAWVERSGIEIDADSKYSTVAIGDDIFMQGQEADEFNEETERIYNLTGDTTMDECAAHLARPYIECLGE